MVKFLGGSPTKEKARHILWEHIAKDTSINGKVIFLSGPDGSDIPVAHSVGIRDLIGVESEPEEYTKVLSLYKGIVPIYREKIAQTVLRCYNQGQKIRSVYLDYCGCLTCRTKKEIRTIFGCLAEGAHISITTCRGRLLNGETGLVGIVSDIFSLTDRAVSFTQGIIYQSKRDKSSGSPMINVSFIIGVAKLQPIVYDLR